MSKRKGWRAWGLAEDEHGPVLRSPEFGKGITGLTFGKRESWARCLERDHKPPKVRCSCGLYSADSLDGARVWLPPGCVAVAGKVELLGRVIEGSPETVNVAMTAFIPLIGQVTGRNVSAEYRSAGVRLVGPQRVHPEHADSVAALAARYGVPFKVDPQMADSADVAEEVMAEGRRRLAALEALSGTGRAAGLVLLNRERTHVVLQLRSEYVDHPNTWAFIGGTVEHGETPTEAALREAWEEARLDPATIDVDRVVKRGGYSYVLAETDWTPEQDAVLPHSANVEAKGAGWVPLAVLDSPESCPGMPLHPKLRKAWPKVRERL